MYHFKKVMKHKNTAGKITALLCLLGGGFLFILANGSLILFPAVAQTVGLILIAAAIYIAVAYLLREYTFSVEANDDFSSGESDHADRYSFRITEAKGKRNIKVVDVQMSEIVSWRIVDPTNRKLVRAERRQMKRFTYDTCFAASRQIEIVAEIDEESYSILVSYDPELLKAFEIFKIGSESENKDI